MHTLGVPLPSRDAQDGTGPRGLLSASGGGANQGQQLVAAISDPFGLGWDLFGTADRRVEFFIATGEPIWYFQLASIVGGTVLGVALAHDRALADFGDDATRPRYAMLLMMVAFTALGLTILAG